MVGAITSDYPYFAADAADISADDFLAVDFLAVDFFATDFFATDFFATDFFATDFFCPFTRAPPCSEGAGARLNRRLNNAITSGS